MNRNMRYPRRNGIAPSCRGCNVRAEAVNAAEALEADCLCDNQPISLAMAYVPNQGYGEIYSPSEGLRHGTIFPELDKPYCAGGRKR